MKKEEPFKELGCILDIVYGVSASFFFYTVVDKYFSPAGNSPSFFSIQSLALILIGIFMIEAYCSVKIVNSIKGYGSTDRFSMDMAIAFLFLFTFQAINFSKIGFIYSIGLIHLLRFVWAFILMSRKKIKKKYIDYMKLISLINRSLFLVCAALTILNGALKKGISFDNLLKLYLLFYFAVLFLFVVIIKFKGIVNVLQTDYKKNFPFRNEFGPILSKFTIFIIFFVIIIVKAVINFIIHLGKSIIGSFSEQAKEIILYLKNKIPPIPGQ